jgi:hypothetical protein
LGWGYVRRSVDFEYIRYNSIGNMQDLSALDKKYFIDEMTPPP